MLAEKIWLLPLLLSFCWISFRATGAFTFAEAAETSKNPDLAQQAFENIQNHIDSPLAKKKPSKLSEIIIIDKAELAKLKNNTRKAVIDDDGTLGYFWRMKQKVNFSGIFTPQLSVFRKETSASEIPQFQLNKILNDSESRRELAVIKLTQKSKGYSIGTQYSYGGNDLKNPGKYKKASYANNELKNDEEKIHVWGGKKIGSLGLKTFISRSWNNVERDPDKYQMTGTFGGAALDFKTPRLPFWFSFSYSQGTSESTMEPDGSKSKGENLQNYGGSLYYRGGEAFDMTLSSSYSPTQDRIRSDEITDTFWHEISANIRPTWKITITPTISFGEYRYLWYGERTKNPSASLSVSLSELFETVDLNFWGYYSGMRGTDGYQDDMMFNTSLGISWKAKYFSSLPNMKFSIDLDHSTYINKIYPESSSNDIGTTFSAKFPL